MATTILPFVIRRRPPSKARPRGETATIIIFPGVRYESVAEDDDQGNSGPAQGTARARRKTKAR